jgi:hypothetical protein
LVALKTVEIALSIIGGWSERSLPLAMVLLTPWAFFQGSSSEVEERAREDGDDDLLLQGGNALEVSTERRDETKRRY